MQARMMLLLIVRVHDATDRRLPLDDRRDEHERLQCKQRSSRDPAPEAPGSKGEMEGTSHQ